VLRVLWAADKALDPAEVRAAMGDDLAYTTIPIILTRLWERDSLFARFEVAPMSIHRRSRSPS
jgi:predicted transcriptional regulator